MFIFFLPSIYTPFSFYYYNFLFIFLFLRFFFLCQFSKLFFNICRKNAILFSIFYMLPYLNHRQSVWVLCKNVISGLPNQILHKLLHNREPITLRYNSKRHVPHNLCQSYVTYVYNIRYVKALWIIWIWYTIPNDSKKACFLTWLNARTIEY